MSEKKIYDVPATKAERDQMRERLEAFVRSRELVPPLSIEVLESLSESFLAQEGLSVTLREWTMVELHNCVWMPVLATIPHERRMLLLPQCLRNSAECEAEIDEVGLLCHRCMKCRIPSLEDRAAELGMMSIVAEGFTTVINLIKAGVIDAVIGVSCLDSLERAFPLLVNNAVPGVAVPLNMAGCKDTTVDNDHVIRMMEAYTPSEVALIDHEALLNEVNSWFERRALERYVENYDDPTIALALDWLTTDGKRWRPYLFAATYAALKGEMTLSEEVKRTAIAVECFHKASLVHDDIEDNDAERYGKPTLNSLHGAAIAINVGDVLLGEGYRQLSQCTGSLTGIIADAHVALCRGQGMELEWCRKPRRVSLEWVIDVFRYKTSPAFEVSLMLGLRSAAGKESLREQLHRYSEALGVAYQLRDDVADYDGDEVIELRPSAVFALLCEMAPSEDFIAEMIEAQNVKEFLRQQHQELLEKALARVTVLAEEYRQRAIEALESINNMELKRLLFRVTARILK